MAITVGNKYYRFLEKDTIELLRLYKIKENELILKDDKNQKVIKTKEEIEKDYILLNPDGYVTFTIAVLENGVKDVIVSLHRKEDIKNNSNCPPYAVCRQNILDLFSNQFVNDEQTLYAGVSITQDTCPNDVPFEIVLACNGVDSMEMVAVYMDDSLSKILSFITLNKYDKILKELSDNVSKLNSIRMIGYSDTLRKLLTENYFRYDFLTAFNIVPVSFKLELKDNNLKIDEQRIFFENLVKHYMFNITVVKYSNDINLKEIKKKYILVSDKTGKLYVLAYEEGEYVNRPFDILKDKRDYIMMKKMGNF